MFDSHQKINKKKKKNKQRNSGVRKMDGGIKNMKGKEKKEKVGKNDFAQRSGIQQEGVVKKRESEEKIESKEGGTKEN